MGANGRKIPWLLAVAIVLQRATNWLFMRRFTVNLGLLKDRGPAVILTTKRFFGESSRLLMDVHSFMNMVKDMATMESKQLESKGYLVQKKDRMEFDFHIPSWAFPQALLECLMAAEEIAYSFKALQDSMDKMIELMRASGMAESEIQKFKDSILNPQKEKTTVH